MNTAPAMSNKKHKQGFTLIELLVVISIIGVLATLLIANFMATRSRARDTQRKSDTRNLATALRLYYNDFGEYPQGAGTINGCGTGTAVCAWGTSFATTNQNYMSYLPNAPRSDDPDMQYNYLYVDDDNFLLTVLLENGSDPAIAPSQIKCGTLGPPIAEGVYATCP